MGVNAFGMIFQLLLKCIDGLAPLFQFSISKAQTIVSIFIIGSGFYQFFIGFQSILIQTLLVIGKSEIIEGIRKLWIQLDRLFVPPMASSRTPSYKKLSPNYTLKGHIENSIARPPETLS